MNSNIHIGRSSEVGGRTARGNRDSLIKKKVQGIMGYIAFMLIAVLGQIGAACVLSSVSDNGAGSFIFVMVLLFCIALAIFTVENALGCISDNLNEIADIKRQYENELDNLRDKCRTEKLQ